jgi:hypothetical protein
MYRSVVLKYLFSLADRCCVIWQYAVVPFLRWLQTFDYFYEWLLHLFFPAFNIVSEAERNRQADTVNLQIISSV